ncbi:MAG: radical SAM protein [Firmicutes bacterium]|nr:radical SAM protein [Bacillota bacterium]
MNLYKGCNHGCIYCDSRSLCYQNTEFDIVKPKADALKIIEKELRHKFISRGVIGTGAMSDPYNALEAQLKLTRSALEIINKYKFGISICTKSSLVTRDIDMLKEIKANAPVIIKFSLSTSDDALSKALEPNVCSSSQRLKAVEQLAKAGIYSGVLLWPTLPFLTDKPQQVIDLLKKAKDSGAKFVMAYFGLTLRIGSRDYFFDSLDKLQKDDLIPKDTKEKYIKRYGTRYICNIPSQKTVIKIFKEHCEKLGLLYQFGDIVKDYQKGYSFNPLKSQMSIFDMAEMLNH